MARSRILSSQTERLLATMLEAPTDWHYGYELSRQTGLQSGTLYPILIRLCDQGLLKAQWRQPDQPHRPARHVYRLTARGVRLAREAVVDGVKVRLVSVKATS